MDLKQYRMDKKMTQSELAAKCYCDRSMIGKIENKTARPSIELAKAIGNALGFDWTLFYEDSEQKGA